ncbi:MAG: hypothetical protein HKP54_07630 [Boseongicola sp.]|nr:hypothetical protein [Boseongicola sp.]
MAFLANPPRVPLFWRNAPSPRPHLIDPLAFFAALILGPIVFTLLTFYLFIPMFALAFGAPTYLTFGALFFWLALRKGWDSWPQITGVGFLANLASAPAVFLVLSHFEAMEATMMIIGMGCIFAPLWSLFFALLYRWLRLDFYTS